MYTLVPTYHNSFFLSEEEYVILSQLFVSNAICFILRKNVFLYQHENDTVLQIQGHRDMY